MSPVEPAVPTASPPAPTPGGGQDGAAPAAPGSRRSPRAPGRPAAAEATTGAPADTGHAPNSPGAAALLARLGLPHWSWRFLTRGCALLTLGLLWWHAWAFTLFFIVFPLLWVTQDTFRAGIRANLLFGAGIAVVGGIGRDPSWVLTALVSTGFSLLMGLWMRSVYVARAQALQALADKQEALEALMAIQARLAAAERAAGAAAERERWAREVHDTLAQGFVSVITLAQTARAAHEALAGPGRAAREDRRSRELGERLQSIEEIARDNLTEARALVAGDAPSALHEAGLASALERLANDQRRHGLEVRLATSLPEGLPVARQVAILRMVQEALSNVVRHAQARTARISAGVEDGEIVISVRDDGRGTRGAPEGTGLSGMRSRLESMAGTLTVDPLHAPDAQGRTGTIVEARMAL